MLIISCIYYYYDKEKIELNDSIRNSAQGSFIRLSNGFVHYELAGPENGELVVFVHGAGSGYYAWNKNFYEIAKAGYRVLRYDLYGRGLSDRPNKVYDLNLFNNQLNELLDSLNISNSFDLVSVSMGAMVAIEQAYKNGNKINKLIFIDPAAIDNGEKQWILKVPYLSDFVMTTYWVPRAVQKQMAEFYKPSMVSEYAGLSETHLKYKGLKRAMLSTWLNACNRSMDKELVEIGKSKSDILLLWGDHDPLTPISLSVKYRKMIPQIKFHEISNAGHLSNYEQPTKVNEYIVNFLKNGL